MCPSRRSSWKSSHALPNDSASSGVWRDSGVPDVPGFSEPPGEWPAAARVPRAPGKLRNTRNAGTAPQANGRLAARAGSPSARKRIGSSGGSRGRHSPARPAEAHAASNVERDLIEVRGVTWMALKQRTRSGTPATSCQQIRNAPVRKRKVCRYVSSGLRPFRKAVAVKRGGTSLATTRGSMPTEPRDERPLVQSDAGMMMLVCLSEPPGDYQIIEADGRAQARNRVFSAATPAAFAQQLANTRGQPVRVLSAVDPAFDDSAIYEPQGALRTRDPR